MYVCVCVCMYDMIHSGCMFVCAKQALFSHDGLLLSYDRYGHEDIGTRAGNAVLFYQLIS